MYITMADSGEVVSDTHLDVYKRQVHARPSDVQRVKSQVTYLQYITDTRSGQKIIVPDSQMQLSLIHIFFRFAMKAIGWASVPLCCKGAKRRW